MEQVCGEVYGEVCGEVCGEVYETLQNKKGVTDATPFISLQNQMITLRYPSQDIPRGCNEPSDLHPRQQPWPYRSLP